jgi:hypothetical protein
MKLKNDSGLYRPGFVLTLLIIILMFSISQCLKAQEPPPRPIKVTVIQDLSFGAFYQGAVGGSVTISTAGLRSATGDVVLLSMGYTFSAAIYRIVGRPGTVVSLLNGPDVLLPGSNGGSLSLRIGNSNPPSPIVLAPGPNNVSVGGTITVSNPVANPPGNFNGTFDITFVQE